MSKRNRLIGYVCLLLFFLSGLTITQIARSQSTPDSNPVDSYCYMQTPTGRVQDLSNLCGQNIKEAEITNLAQAAISAQNQALVSGDIEPRRRAALEAHQIKYTGFQSDLKVKNIQIQGNQATVEATEYTVLQLQVGNGDPLAPKTTEYEQDHRFTFVLENGQWKLSSDQLFNMPGSFPPEKGATLIDQSIPSLNLSESQTKDNDNSNEMAQQASNLKDLSPLKYISNPTADEAKNPDSNTQLIADLPKLNRKAIVDYAYKYWKNYNRDYRPFPNDCTNFVSQAVTAGGWPEVIGFYTSNSAWWYHETQPYFGPGQSYSWAGAQNWFNFTKNRPRGKIVEFGKDLEIGDIIQFDEGSNGSINHTAIVTKIDSRDTPYLTYHTNNTKDKSLWEFLSISPKPIKVKAWHLDSSIK